MSHFSRLSKIVVDVSKGQAESVETFWESALGSPMGPVDGAPEYSGLKLNNPKLLFFVQTLKDPMTGPVRMHIDIHTDNVPAEVARLASLGASEVRRVHSWVVMADPAGLAFCIIPAAAGALNSNNSTQWPDL